MRARKQGTFLPQIGKSVVRLLNSTIDLMVLILVLTGIFLGGYAIWDSGQVDQEASAVRYEQYKPDEKDAHSLTELKQINPDVCGWLTVYGTNIDYPLVQGTDNETYVNTNVMKEPELSGSLFLDYRNKRDFSDFNNIIYGHHMMNQVMFGEIGEFKDASYFKEHRYGNLSYEGKDHGIEFLIFLEADAYDRNIYAPGIEGRYECQAYLEYLMAKALHIRQSNELVLSDAAPLVLLSTCYSGVTNGRHILVGRVSDQIYKDPFQNKEDIGGGFGGSRLANGFLWWGAGGVWMALLVVLIVSSRRKKSDQKGKEGCKK